MDTVVVPVVVPYSAPLSQGFGYGIVIGLGFVFALGMIGTTRALKRYSKFYLSTQRGGGEITRLIKF